MNGRQPLAACDAARGISQDTTDASGNRALTDAARSLFLEADSDRQGQVPGLNLRALNGAECGIGVGATGEIQGKRSIRVARVKVVEHVKGLCA